MLDKNALCEKLKEIVKYGGLPDKYIKISYNEDKERYLYSADISDCDLRLFRFTEETINNYLNDLTDENKNKLLNEMKKALIVSVTQILSQ